MDYFAAMMIMCGGAGCVFMMVQAIREGVK